VNPIRSLALVTVWALVPLALVANPPGRIAAPSGTLAGTLEVAVAGGEIRATLTFINHSQKVVWLEKTEGEQAHERSEFEIRSSDGRQVPYAGPTAKPKAHAKDDFFALEPGQTSRRELRIDDRYRFPDGEREYRATFSYLFWNPKTRQVASRSLKPVKFKYGR
jgi:hypothetical protein